MAYESEIQFRVKVLDKELRDLERRAQGIQDRFSGLQGSPRSRSAGRRTAVVRAKREEADLIRRSIEDLDRLRETKAQKTQQTNLRRVRFLRDQRIQAARDVANAEKKFAADQLKRDKAAIASRRAAASARSKKFQNVATGAGFPLLFGGGPLQALAGGIGGAAGGLGGSIAASAITAQVEAFAKDTAAVGQSLGSVSGALELMREKSLFSKDATEELAAELEGLGEIEKLSTLLTTELVQKIGNEGVTALQDLGTESDKTTRLWSALTLQLQALIAGPLKDFFALINSVLGAVTTSGQFKVLESELTGQARTDFDADVASRRAANLATTASGATGASGMMSSMGTAGGVGVLSPADQRELVEKYLPKLQVTADIPDRGGIKPPKDTAGKRAAQDEARLQQKLAGLEQERQKILQISAFKDKIAAAEAASDSQLVIRLKGEQRVAQIESKRLTDLIKVKDQRLIDAININAATEKLAAQRQTEREITEEQSKRQERFAKTIENLEHQLLMTQATSQAERDRLEIQQKLNKLRKDGMKEPQLAQAKNLMQQIDNENAPLNKFIKKSVESLNDLEASAVRVSQGIGNAIGGSLASGLEGLVSGAKSIKDVFADMLKSVGQTLVQEGTKMIATYIAIGIARAFAGLAGDDAGAKMSKTQYFNPQTGLGVAGPNFGLADGGAAKGGQPYLVGERGPELFVPFQNGSITSNEQLDSQTANAMSVPFLPGGDRGNSVSRYERMSSSFREINQTSVPFTRTSEQAAAAASERETAQAIANPSPIDVRFESQSINGVEYVTADQHQQGMSQAAERGRALTLAALQNSVKSRRRVGL
jgi:hypothetical protein